MYIGASPHYFKGKMFNDGKYWVVRGMCKTNTSQGEFEIYKDAPRDTLSHRY